MTESAYAANGQYDRAVEIAQEAIELANASHNTGLARHITREMAQYRTHQAQ